MRIKIKEIINMSESIADDDDMIQIKEMTIDQLAGAVVLFLGM